MAKRAEFWVLASGKGGVGKSVLALNMGIALAQSGRRVLLLDTDLGLANLHILGNVEPRGHLERVLGGAERWQDAVTPLPWGPDLIAAENGQSICLMRDNRPGEALAAALGDLHTHYDYVLVDTPRGISDAALQFCMACDRTLLVTTDEPTSITNSYAWFKIAGMDSPSFPIWLVANGTADRELYSRFRHLCERFLDRAPEWGGIIPPDPLVSRSVAVQQPLFKVSPNGTAWRAMQQLTQRLQQAVPQTVTSTDQTPIGAPKRSTQEG